MTENSILIFAVFLVFLVAVAISAFVIYRQTNRLLKDNGKLMKDNSHLTHEVESLKEEIEEHQKALEELKGQLRTIDKVTELQQETKSLRENIKGAQEMSDEELSVWIDLQVTESRMFCDPELDIKTMAQKLGLTQKKVKQLLKDSTRYERLYDYLTEKRVLYACELIKENPQWSIDAVSKEAGFVSRTTFQTEFKKRIGVTPAQYRKHTQTEVVRVELN
jgi:AraC-like DNA-binding protein